MRIILVKPYPELLIAKRLQQSFLHLEPLELEIVAGGIPADNDIRILDLSLEKDPVNAFSAMIQTWRPDLVGFGGYSSNVGVVKRLAGMAKQMHPTIITVVGGIHATLLPADYAISDIDIIVRGEGGNTLGEVVRRAKAGEPLHIDNCALSPSDPEFSHKAELAPPAYPKPEQIPRPRRDLVDRSRYFCVWSSSDTPRLKTMFPRVASLRTSIGCAFSCSFCVIPHLMNGKYLQRTPEDVVDEIAGIKEEYIYFVDDEMFLNPVRTRKIAELLIERGIKKKYTSWARSDTIVRHADVLRLWKTAGLDTLYVGLESMDESKLDEYKKRVPVETNQKAIAMLREIGITLHASFIVHPDFSVEDFRRLEKVVLDVCPAEVTFTVLSPSPGTQFWHEHKHEFICDPYRFYDCMHSILPTRLPLKLFYAHFSRLTQLALRNNPLRRNKIKIPLRDLFRAIVYGTQYIIALRMIYRDYPMETK
ncbi:MAG TPA: radical SAM protein [Candidatus Hydrogenedentes bacterium]|nr:radical SAM protein [Candidatus Hydrogenedentota bacterium]